jgi:hypothetical protein
MAFARQEASVLVVDVDDRMKRRQSISSSRPAAGAVPETDVTNREAVTAMVAAPSPFGSLDCGE